MPAESSIDASSRAEISGVMVVDSADVAAGKPKTVFITGAFYTTLDTVMGVFRYFNMYNYVFEPGSRWFVNTTVRSCHFFCSL
jgi:hypothetical protein